MGRTARDKRPNLPHVERIELSWENYKLRIIAAAVFLVIGAGALAYGVSALLGTDAGWQTVRADSGAEINCAGDFTLLYELGAGDTPATAENKALVTAYTQAAVEAYRMFNARESFEGVANLYTLNSGPNQALTVEDALYEALEQVIQSGDRSIYLGPAYEIYNGIFSCQADWETENFDPRVNPDIRALFEEIAAFARDSESVDLELLGNGQVRLKVSREYLDFLEDHELTRTVDFCWMQNAFIADYLAERLTERGFTHGSLSSYDGFVRNLDSREGSYSLNLYHREEGAVLTAGVMGYNGPMAIVCLRGYPLSSQDSWHYYQLESGEIRTPYLDIDSGLDRSGGDELVCCSASAGCAETLLRTLPVYMAGELSAGALAPLAAEGIHAVWIEGRTVCYNQRDLTLAGLYSGENGAYTARFAG